MDRSRPGIKLKSLTIEDKVRAIESIESGRKISQVAADFDIPRNTMHSIYKGRIKLIQQVLESPSLCRNKRIVKTKNPEMECRLLAFLDEARSKNERITGALLKNKALVICSELEIQGFGASNGWLQSFLQRNDIQLSSTSKKLEDGKRSEVFRYLHIVSPKNDVDDVCVIEDRDELDFEEIKYDHEPEHELETFIEDIDAIDNQESYIEYQEEMEEEIPQLTIDYHTWCRLCGNCEDVSLVEEDDISEIVQQMCFISATVDLKICSECYTFLKSISSFVNKTQNIDGMYQELQQKEESDQLTDEAINDIRTYFGLNTTIDKGDNLYEITTIDVDLENDKDLQVIQRYGAASEDDSDFRIEDSMQDEDEYEEVHIEGDEEILYEEIDAIEELDVEDYADKMELDLKSHPSDVQSEEKTSVLIKTADEEKYQFICHVCLEEFPKMFLLSTHTRSKHNCLPRVACMCGKLLATWDSLLAHQRKHTSDTFEFDCNICNAKFKTRNGLTIHIKFKHTKLPQHFNCLQCGKNFATPHILKIHEKVHLPDDLKYTYQCHICNKMLTTATSLKLHISTVHEHNKQFICELCNKGFSTKSNLRSHLICHTTEIVSCDICDGKFKNKVSLQSHKKMHKPPSDIVFGCSMCSKEFRTKKQLEVHMISHSDERDFKCNFCANAYKRAKDLKNHLSVHTGERPHQCQFCDRKFIDNANCRKHKLKDHPDELAKYESVHGKRRGTYASYSANNQSILS